MRATDTSVGLQGLRRMNLRQAGTVMETDRAMLTMGCCSRKKTREEEAS